MVSSKLKTFFSSLLAVLLVTMVIYHQKDRITQGIMEKSIVNSGYSTIQESEENNLRQLATTNFIGGSDESTISNTKFFNGDLRFNKFDFIDDAHFVPGFKPLTSISYPIQGTIGNILKSYTTASSVVTPGDNEVVIDPYYLIQVAGGLPGMPEDKYSRFWDELRFVIQVQEIRKSNPKRVFFPLPLRWKNRDLNEIAEFVHDEFPALHQSILLSDMLKGVYGYVDVDSSVIPRRSYTTFLRKNFLVGYLNQWATSVVGAHSFAVKYIVGRPRPEEAVWAIKTGKLKAPNDITQAIINMNLQNQFQFTAYSEGSPMHPSWPAMHGAASCASVWLAVVLNLNPVQKCQAILTDYAVSFARTAAGVHYPEDNIAGLTIGQEVVKKLLPSHLAEKYGADETIVRLKIEREVFDWRNFDPSNPCPFL